MQSFGEYLTYLMKKKEIGPSTLARKANIPLQTINSWRAEHVKRPRNLEQILSAAHVLQLNISEVEGLLGAAGQPSLSLLQKHPQTELVSSLLMTWRKNPVSSHEIPPTDLSLWKLMPFGQDARIPDVSTLPAGSNMPFAKNSIFVGRSNQLREISKELKDGGKSIGQIVAITGTGGLGKSQLATEFVHRYGRFFDGGVYWINCANSANIDQEIAQCALKMGKPEIGIPELSKWAQTEWLKPVPRLLIFDNCEENELLQKYRPITGGCRILITCRRQEWWPTLGVKTIQLDTLSKESSIKLLQNIAPRISVNEAHELSAAVEYFPLALHVIGSYLRINKIISANKFLKRLSQANRLEHPALRGEDSASSPTNHDHHLARTFQFSWEQFEANNQIDQAARQILFFASFLAPNTFLPTVILWHLLRKQFLTESSLDDQGQEHIFSQSLDKALNIGLVRQMEGGMVLHGLVKNFIQSQLQAHQFNIYQETINQVFIDEFKNLSIPEKAIWFPHVKLITDHMQNQKSVSSALLLQETGYYLDETARFEEGLQHYEKALEIWNQIDQGVNDGVATLYDLIGISYFRRGEYTQALPYYQNALKMRETVFGSTHPRTLTSLNNLGYELSALGDYDQAEPILKKALKFRTRLLGPNHLDTISTKSYLGLLYTRMGRFQESAALLEFVFDQRAKILGLDHTETSIAANYLGFVLHDMKKYERAEYYYNVALDIDTKHYGEGSPWQARNLNNLGVLYYEQERYDEAIDYLEHAFEINAKGYGDDSFYTAQNLHNLGRVYFKLYNLDQSKSYFEKAFKIREQVVGIKHIETNRSMGYLGIVNIEDNKPQIGKKLIAKALKNLLPILGKDHHEIQLMETYT